MPGLSESTASRGLETRKSERKVSANNRTLAMTFSSVIDSTTWFTGTIPVRLATLILLLT